MEDSGALQKLMKMTMRKFKQMGIYGKKVNMFVYLPDDILEDIFKRLPDAFLRYKAKYVCRQWFDIITNRLLLDHASFILQEPDRSYKAQYVDIREEGQGLEAKVHHLDIPCRGKIESWCNEFLLIRDPVEYGCIYVFNLITKEGSYLPHCGSYHCCGNIALSFDGLKGVYKVLSVDMGPPLQCLQCHILIFKSDIVSGVSLKWKKIKVPKYMIQGMYRTWCHPVSIQCRYFHWISLFSNFLVSVDMVKEKIFQLHLPRSFGDHEIFEMHGFLALIGGTIWGKPHIWILKDFQRMEWEKFHTVAFPNHYSTIYYYLPRVIVIYKRYMICNDPKAKNGMCSFDVKYGVVKELNIKIKYGDVCLVHTSSPSFI